jgi:hypothetical protein
MLVNGHNVSHDPAGCAFLYECGEMVTSQVHYPRVAMALHSR